MQAANIFCAQNGYQVIAPQLQKSQSMRRLLIDELSSAEAFAGDRLWALLSDAPGDAKIDVKIFAESFSVDAIDVVRRQGLIVFTMPCLPAEDESEVFLKLSTGDLNTQVPINYRVNQNKVLLRVVRSKSEEANLVDNLFEFAGNGEALALLQPFAGLIKNVDVEGNNVLHVASRNGQSYALKLFLSVVSTCDKEGVINQQNQRGLTPLHSAIRSGDPDAVHYLMNHGALTNICDCHRNTAVHYLSDAYNESIYKEILEPTRGQQTDVDSLNDEGLAPLHVAVKRLKLTLIEMLLDAGASLEAKDKCSKTALLHAVTMNDVEIIQLLLQRKANVNVEDETGETPLSASVLNANYPILGLLIDNGGDPKIKNSKGFALSDSEDIVVQNIINGERMELPQKEYTTGVPHDLATSRSPLFDNHLAGRSHPDNAPNEDARRSRVVIRSRDAIISDAELLLQETAGSSSPQVHDYLDDDDLPGPSTSGSRQSRRSRQTAQKLKDDVSNLDYLTRLRVSKIFDQSQKWQKLAQELGCDHMIELISICSDDSGESSPTMIFLDQFEQMPDANITRLREAITRLGEEEAGKLVDARYVY